MRRAILLLGGIATVLSARPAAAEGPSPYQHSLRGDVLRAAAGRGSMTEVKAALKLGAPVNYSWYRGDNVGKMDTQGLTPLHQAVANDHLPIMNVLFDHHADVNAHTVSGITPLMTAVKNDRVDAMKALVAHHANIEQRDDSGNTAMFTAATSGNAATTQALIDLGAKVNAKSSVSNDSPLHYAAFAANAAVVKLLLAHGADINAVNRTRETPLAGLQNNIRLNEGIANIKGIPIEQIAVINQHLAEQRSLAEYMIRLGAH